MENKKHEILLGLTTTPGSDWRRKVDEMNKFDIKRIALFPTFLGLQQRKELYALLEKIEGLEIPHVHLRGDMELWELNLLVQKYGARVFNLHSVQEFPVLHDYSKYTKQIYLENTPGFMPSDEEIDKCNGFCVDFSHWEDGMRRKDFLYDGFAEKIKKNNIGCCHVSAIRDNASLARFHSHDTENPISDFHYFEELSEFDYLVKYTQYLPPFISLELENSFEEQLRVKKYLEKILEI